MKSEMRSITIPAAVAAILMSTLGLPGAFAAAGDKVVDQTEEQAREGWRQAMHRTNPPEEGCFEASYPRVQWEKVECATPPGYRSALRRQEGHELTAGNGYDYVALTPGGQLISSALGSFTKVTGVRSESSVGVAAFGGGGILGPNEYTLQVNTNFYNSAACNGYSYCLAWQQYVMATNTPASLTSNKLTGSTEVFIEYWLINYGVDNGSNICPKGFLDAGADGQGPGDDCVQNTPAVVVYKGQLPITDLAGLTLSGSATANGTDKATVTFDTHAYTATVADKYTDIATGWDLAEFNVVGNAGGSRADFNSGSSLTLKVAVRDGSTTAPICVPPADFGGTTGETNNLRLGKCTESGGSAPYIQFSESN